MAEATTRKDRAMAEGKRHLRCGRLVGEELLTYENGEETARAGGREAAATKAASRVRNDCEVARGSRRLFTWLNLHPIRNGVHTDASVCATTSVPRRSQATTRRDGEARVAETARAGGREGRRYKSEGQGQGKSKSKGCPNLGDGSAATEAKSKATATARAGGREARRYKGKIEIEIEIEGKGKGKVEGKGRAKGKGEGRRRRGRLR